MSAPKYAPGPYRRRPGFRSLVILDARGESVAHVLCCVDVEDEPTADLLAAAPDFAALVAEMHETCTVTGEWQQKAREALQKAGLLP